MRKLILLLLLICLNAGAAPRVTVNDDRLTVDGVPQPQLYGAEIQYFRLRGGYGPNVPKERVIALWNKVLDQAVSAKINAVSFYIPWDFHEFAEGKFDFTGTVDADGDGQPDYPSRDVLTFIKLIKAHGITRIMVRPGPYINAEWGFLGFGAIPQWFHEKYPDSHMRTFNGLKSRLYDYHNEDFLRHVKLWFKAVYENVIRDEVGPGKPIIFVQLDNETNYSWQSIYANDYAAPAVSRYQDFLQKTYTDLTKLNLAHDRHWQYWEQIQPPWRPKENSAEDQDWYRFADNSMYTYLQKIRKTWENLGLTEDDGLFTLAESYNAPAYGVLPNYVLRNARGKTGMMTVNIYPKTFETPDRPLLNFPFKVDLDVKSADIAKNSYLGQEQQFVMGPEIQSGWWKGIQVSPAARQQIYLSALGHGLKAFFIYYFNEGENWGADWAYQKIKPYFDEIIYARRLQNIPLPQLPYDFWSALQAQVDHQVLNGFDVRKIMEWGPKGDQDLYFDAPIKANGEPREHFQLLKDIGEKVIQPYLYFLGHSLAVTDSVAIVKDSTAHQVNPLEIPSEKVGADWAGGLLGNLLAADYNPQIVMPDLPYSGIPKNISVYFHIDDELNDPKTLDFLQGKYRGGAVIVNFLGQAVGENIGYRLPVTQSLSGITGVAKSVVFYLDKDGLLTSRGSLGASAFSLSAAGPIYTYDTTRISKNCSAILYYGSDVAGFRCVDGRGVFIQIGALTFAAFNSSDYGKMTDFANQVTLIKAVAKLRGVQNSVQLSGQRNLVTAFARKGPKEKIIWITVKSGAAIPQRFKVKVARYLINGISVPKLQVKNLLESTSQVMTSADIVKDGFEVSLGPEGSAVFAIEGLVK